MSGRLTPIRAALAAVVAGVPGIGRVYGWQPYCETAEQLRATYFDQASAEIRGATIRRVAGAESWPHVGQVIFTDRWEIRAFSAYRNSEAGEDGFDERIEAVRSAIRADATLVGAVDDLILSDRSGGAQVAESGPALLAGVLVYSARLQLSTVMWS
jgi:hypothetical protein